MARISTTTDGSGKFEFNRLTAGRYVVSAIKPGFVELQYGQRRPFEPSKYVDVGDTPIEGIDVVLLRGGVVTGRVVDEQGEAVADAAVSAWRSHYVRGQRQLTAVSVGRELTRTNDVGEFRLSALPPGSYLVSATLGGAFVENAGQDVSMAYARTFYPGVLSPDEAQAILVEAGTETTASLALLPASLSHIRGSVIDSQGRLANQGIVRLVATASNSGSAQVIPLSKEGTFAASVVMLAGTYTVTATTSTAPRTAGLPPSAEFGKSTVAVAPGLNPEIRITTSPGSIISGRVILADEIAEIPLPVKRVYTQPVVRGESWVGPATAIRPDGTFELYNVFGRSLVTVDVARSPGWVVKQIFAGDTDVSATGIEPIPGTRVDDLMIVLTRATAQMDGEVVTDNQQPADDCVALAFTSEQEKWKDPLGRYVHIARCDANGHYSLLGLLPGKYFAIALATIDAGSTGDPDILAKLQSRATVVTVARDTRRVRGPRLTVR